MNQSITQGLTQTQDHFAGVASAYREARTTDLEPIKYISKHVRRMDTIIAADVGAGAGRYDLLLLRELGSRLRLRCVDVTVEMLAELDEYLQSEGVTGYSTHLASADGLPFSDHALDYVFTFNACHHFDLPAFLAESRRTLRIGGRMFIYTRTRAQNERGSWVRYFPEFAERETRLYTLGQMAAAVAGTPGLELTGIEEFQYDRVVDMDRLVFQAENHHYSTFKLYDPDEFESAMEHFINNVKSACDDTERIPWRDENIMYVVDRTE